MPKNRRVLPIKDNNNNLICCNCSIYKPPKEFYNNKSKSHIARGGKESICIDCKKKYDVVRSSRKLTVREFLIRLAAHTKCRTSKEYDINPKYLLELYNNQKGLCAISGVMMTYMRGSGRVYTNISIDRIDNSKGYIKGNVHLVCDVVNFMKHTLTINELIEWCKLIIKLNTNGTETKTEEGCSTPSTSCKEGEENPKEQALYKDW